MRKIDVTALPDGWRVAVDQVANDMIFRSGRAAERAALRLAHRLARADEASEIRVYLRNGELAARFLCPASGVLRRDAAPRPPSSASANLRAA